jgi:required for meiotic nuclear division protein 1
MLGSKARASTIFAGQNVIASCRRAARGSTGWTGLQPLPAASASSLPRRHDLFSSSAFTRHRSQQPSDDIKEGQTQKETPSLGLRAEVKRKPGRTSAAKTSLRRAAVEAQRSKENSLPTIQRADEGAQTSKAVTAYAVAEQFDLAKVDEILRAQGYEPDPFKTGLYPQVLHIQLPLASIHRTAKKDARELSPSEVGDVFIFPSGTLVSWSLPEQFVSYLATHTLLPAAKGSHMYKVEYEDLEYVEDSSKEQSSIKGDTIMLGTKQDHSLPSERQKIDSVFTKIAFSSGFARSTKLAVLESMLLEYFESTRDIPTLLSQGSRLPYDRSFVLRKTGQLLSLRAQLNLYSELTDSLPDLFWDSRYELGLEGYYDQVGKALDVGIRIKVLNEKMDYAQEIASVLRERLSETHGLRLEWIIIALIAVEVGFEVLRLWKEGWLERKEGKEEAHPLPN